MKKILSLLLAAMLCCAIFASCGKAEQEPKASDEPSVEVEASPSPTPEPRTEVEIPEELKFCDEPLYYGMTIEEIREIFGREDETSEKDFYQTGNLIGKHVYYKYNNAQCQGREDGIIQRIWKAKDHDGINVLAKLADGPEIKIESRRVRFWGSVRVREEAAAYKESGKQGVTSDNLRRLKIGMTSDQAKILLGPYTERTAKYAIGGIPYATFVWENEELWNVRITIEIKGGKINAIYSSGL